MYKPAANKILVDILVKSGLLSPQEAEECTSAAKSERRNLHNYLIRHDVLTDRQIIEALAQHLKLEIIDLKQMEIPSSVIDRIPVKFASFYEFMPVAIEGNSLKLAISSPLDVRVED